MLTAIIRSCTGGEARSTTTICCLFTILDCQHATIYTFGY